MVPLPSWSAVLWREHVTPFGTADDGRLTSSERGGIISHTTYHRVRHETRDLALRPALTAGSSPPEPKG